MTTPGLDDLLTLARKALGPDDGEAYARLARPAVRLEPAAEAGATAPGRSRLGGDPLLPRGCEWPRWDGRPLSFLVLLDLADLAGTDLGDLHLPPAGLLNVFYEADEQRAWGFDPDHADGWRIVVADPASAVTATPPDDTLRFPTRPLRIRPVLTVPEPGEDEVAALRERHGDALWDLHESWIERPGHGEPRHQVGGWPALVQGPLPVECQLASHGVYVGDGEAYTDPRHEELRAGAGGWRLLVQIDSDDDVGWMWGDVGTLYFCVPDAVPDAAALEAAWMVFQCC